MGHGSICVESLKVMIYITGFSVLLILFIQSLHRKIPTITIEELYIPSFNNNNNNNKTATENSTTNILTAATTIYFDLKLDNKNPVGIYYRPMNLTFSYFPNKATSSNTSTKVHLGVYTIRGFHQNHHKEKHVRGTVVFGGMIMVQPPSAGTETSIVVMRLDLVGRVKFKSIAQWKRTMLVGVDVEVDQYTGKKVTNNAINLVPSAAVVSCICSPAIMLLMLILLITS